MSDPAEKSPIIKAATNEWSLLTWRAAIAGLVSVGTAIGGVGLAWLAEIKTSQGALKTDFQAYQLSQEARLGRLEGDVSGIKGSILVHRDRLIGIEGDQRSMWQRIYDARMPQPTNRGTP